MWRDLLRVFFNLPVHYLYGGSTASYAAHATAGDDASLLSSPPSPPLPLPVLRCLHIHRSSLIPLLASFTSHRPSLVIIASCTPHRRLRARRPL